MTCQIIQIQTMELKKKKKKVKSIIFFYKNTWLSAKMHNVKLYNSTETISV